MSEFDGLTGFDDWSTKLHEILAATRQAAMSGDLASYAVALDRLVGFVDESPEELDDLDDIAREAINDLGEQQAEQLAAAIASRSAELATLTKKVAAITGGASKSARWISLESPAAIARSLTDGLVAFKELRDQLEADGLEEDTLKQVDSVKRAIERLRRTLEDEL